MRTDYPKQLNSHLIHLFFRWARCISTAGTARSRAGNLEYIGQLGIRQDKTTQTPDFRDMASLGAVVVSLIELAAKCCWLIDFQE